MKVTTLVSAFVCVALALGSAAADPVAPSAPAKPIATKVSPCTRTIVGHGLDRHVVCTFNAPLIVKASRAAPQVLIAPTDGRQVVGHPRTPDRLADLPHQLN